MNKVYLLPTGDEIQSGVVLDLDTPELVGQLLRAFPTAEITRLRPLSDREEAIVARLRELLDRQPDLIVLIGGSGGGHRHSATLGKDFTHSALEECLEHRSTREIYGKNGHLWSKLICGKSENTLVLNVPGPLAEARAAMTAFLKVFVLGADTEAICQAMADAVLNQYPRVGEEPAARIGPDRPV